MRLPRVLQITAGSVLPPEEVLARLDRVSTFDVERRARFAVQLRDPELCTRELLSFGSVLRERTASMGAQLVVNDRLDLAELLGADGVHLGRHSVSPDVVREHMGSKVWISQSCHSMADLEASLDAGVELSVLCPIFPSPGKAEALGLGGLRAAIARAAGEAIPIMALGGLDLDGAQACLAAGAAGVASIRSDLTALL